MATGLRIFLAFHINTTSHTQRQHIYTYILVQSARVYRVSSSLQAIIGISNAVIGRKLFEDA